jgi:hypothetical protein
MDTTTVMCAWESGVSTPVGTSFSSMRYSWSSYWLICKSPRVTVRGWMIDGMNERSLNLEAMKDVVAEATFSWSAVPIDRMNV